MWILACSTQCQVTLCSASGCVRLQACHCSLSRRCWWSHLFLHINSILSPDQGRTPAFHCGGAVRGGVQRGWGGYKAGWATCWCYYSRATPRRTHICMQPHTLWQPRTIIPIFVFTFLRNHTKLCLRLECCMFMLYWLKSQSIVPLRFIWIVLCDVWLFKKLFTLHAHVCLTL